MNRIGYEQNVSDAIKQIIVPHSSLSIADNLEQKNNNNDNNISLRELSKSINDTPQLHFSTKKKMIHGNKSELIKTSEGRHHDPNVLCDRLRKLLSSLLAGEKNCMGLINTIIYELRDLEIII